MSQKVQKYLDTFAADTGLQLCVQLTSASLKSIAKIMYQNSSPRHQTLWSSGTPSILDVFWTYRPERVLLTPERWSAHILFTHY